MIYRLSENFETYMRFYIANTELYSKMGDDITINMGGGSEKYSDHWIKPDGYFYKNDKEYPYADRIPDITIWADRLVLNKKASQTLSDKLGSYGEFLPVNCEGTTYYILNILTFAEDFAALDEDESEYYEIDGYQTDLKKLAFRQDKLKEVLIFKTQYDGFSRIFCNDKFKTLIEESELNGLVFRTDLEGVM